MRGTCSYSEKKMSPSSLPPPPPPPLLPPPPPRCWSRLREADDNDDDDDDDDKGRTLPPPPGCAGNSVVSTGTRDSSTGWSILVNVSTICGGSTEGAFWPLDLGRMSVAGLFRYLPVGEGAWAGMQRANKRVTPERGRVNNNKLAHSRRREEEEHKKK